MDKMILANQKPVHFVNECELYQGYQEGMEACVERQEEVNYVGGQGYNKFNPNYRNHPNLSYHSTNVENPQDQTYPPQKPPGFPSQPNYQPNPQGNYQAKPQTYSQPQQQMNAPHPQGTVDDTNALLRQLLEGQGRGAIELATQMKAMHHKVENVYGALNAKIERLKTQVQGQALSSSPRQIGSLPGKPKPNSKEFCNAIFTKEVNRVTIEKTEKGSRGNEIVTKEVEKKDAPSVAFSLYSPPLPFPQRVLTKAKKKVLSSFKANMSRVGAPLPYVDSLSQVPLHIEFLKAILANKEKVEEIMGIFDSPSEQQPGPKSLSKIEDPGRFTILCSLGALQLDDALCNSGASVNVMSLEMVKSLGIKDMKQPSSSIMFGDASSKSPLDFIENYPLKVGDCTVPTDFMVVETNKLPLIL
ncbi:PREDICTED: uncharacterized protein LOC104783651 [Camelina sativa]|uniref:Uncharacterized protein LOC104783651 n=1 Tax=Camelina sativa TaxID=90675 RepID=A0ABM0YWV6_CAMSA|nr:PREDICTED: uncharacterized protein LOC104783651 [Camelina sativa]